jgi:hypothetical protein
MMPETYDARSVTIGCVKIEVNEDGNVVFTDSSSTKPPIVFFGMVKARAMVSMLLRAVKRLPHPTPGITYVDERQHRKFIASSPYQQQ